MDILIVPSLSEVDAADWNRVAGDDNPFVEHAFLKLLEDTGCVGPGAGWVPHYIVAQEDGRTVGATFTYLKDNSYGEYIFDWGWADASHRAGIPYYPKLVVAVPFTPATGPRFLVAPGEDKDRVRAGLLQGVIEVMKHTEAMSLHVLFCDADEAGFLEDAGLLRRSTHQFHWRNPGYADFDDFLGDLRSSARKQIRKERRRVHESGLDIAFVRGDELDDDDWQVLYKLYLETASRKWGRPYLNRAFFREAKAHVGHLARVGIARRDGRVLAGTLSFEKGPHLYGRYWGAFAEQDGLHFELCYYQHIEHAIAQRMTLVEAGAQGQHKVKRGYLPVITHSAHLFRTEGLGHAVADMLAREREHMVHEIEAWQKEGPFREDALPPFPAEAGVPLTFVRDPDGA